MAPGCTGPALLLPANVSHPGIRLPGDEAPLRPNQHGGFETVGQPIEKQPPPPVTYFGAGN